jgi:hypothetical protein
MPSLSWTDGLAPQSRTFPAQDTRCKQGHAFANRFSRDRRFLEKDKQCLCGHPDDQQESGRSHSKHYKRPEMMIFALPAQRAFLVHIDNLYNPETNGQSLA